MNAIYKLIKCSFFHNVDRQYDTILVEELCCNVSHGRGMAYLQIFRPYTNFVQKNYGKAIIVFVGYGNASSTTGMTHQRSTGGSKGTVVKFDDGPYCEKKSYSCSIQQISKYLSIHLKESSSQLDASYTTQKAMQIP